MTSVEDQNHKALFWRAGRQDKVGKGDISRYLEDQSSEESKNAQNKICRPS